MFIMLFLQIPQPETSNPQFFGFSLFIIWGLTYSVGHVNIFTLIKFFVVYILIYLFFLYRYEEGIVYYNSLSFFIISV